MVDGGWWVVNNGTVVDGGEAVDGGIVMDGGMERRGRGRLMGGWKFTRMRCNDGRARFVLRK